MELHSTARDLYLRHTDTNGHSTVQLHRVWSVEKFLAAEHAAAAKLNSEQKGDEPRLAAVQQITRDQYHTERQARK